MLVTPPFGASSNIALWRAYSKPPVELVVADLEHMFRRLGLLRALSPTSESSIKFGESGTFAI